MAGSEKNTTRSISLSNDMACSRCTQNSILSDQQLLYAVGRSNLGNQLHHFWVVVSPISSNDQEAALNAFGNRQKDTGDEGFAIVLLLEDGDFFAKARSKTL